MPVMCCAPISRSWSSRMVLRTDRKGRSKYPEGPFWPLPYSQCRHPAFRALSGAALKVYAELHSRYQVRGDGRSNNNGSITLALGEASRLLQLGKTTVQRALMELEAAGFIFRTKRGHWYGRKAAEFRLTDCPCQGSAPSRDWQRIWLEKQNAVPERNAKHYDGSVSGPAP